MSRRERRRRDAGDRLVPLSDVPEQLDPTDGTARGRIRVDVLDRDADPEAYQALLEEFDIPEDPRGGEADTTADESGESGADSPDTSIEDLTSEAQPEQFDRTFAAADADLTLQGRFDPVAGEKQVLPRVAYTINYNFIWNPDRQRWEPDTGNGSGVVSVADSGVVTVSSGGQEVIDTSLTDPTTNGDTLFPAVSLDSAPGDAVEFNWTDEADQGSDSVAVNFTWNPPTNTWRIVLSNGEPTSVDVRWAICRVSL